MISFWWTCPEKHKFLIEKDSAKNGTKIICSFCNKIFDAKDGVLGAMLEHIDEMGHLRG